MRATAAIPGPPLITRAVYRVTGGGACSACTRLRDASALRGQRACSSACTPGYPEGPVPQIANCSTLPRSPQTA